jgi:hypothetical protein
MGSNGRQEEARDNNSCAFVPFVLNFELPCRPAPPILISHEKFYEFYRR